MFTNAEAALAFTFGGRAILTLQSEETGAHYTYRVTQSEGNPHLFFVALLTAPDTYTYMGVCEFNDFRLTAKSQYDKDSTPVKAFRYYLGRARGGVIAPKLIVRHEGRCGRCGRELTHPESIDAGFGPECIKHV